MLKPSPEGEGFNPTMTGAIKLPQLNAGVGLHIHRAKELENFLFLSLESRESILSLLLLYPPHGLPVTMSDIVGMPSGRT